MKWAIWALVGMSLSACSTVRPADSGRRGLFTRNAARSPSESREAGDSQEEPQAPRVSASSLATLQQLNLHWPLRAVRITSRFGRRQRDFHEGIDLKAAMGTEVYATQAGRVIYAGTKIRGYGKMIVIKHGLGVATVYGHNSRLLVKKGQVVRLGQLIAISGNTGHSTGPHLHFEVRRGVTALDPAQVLPLSRVALARDSSPRRAPASRLAAANY